MITVTYTARSYRPEDVCARYVRVDSTGKYYWCEVGPNRRDIRQGRCHARDLPADVRDAAAANRGNCPSYVEWSRT
jgi:hypothetical protein